MHDLKNMTSLAAKGKVSRREFIQLAVAAGRRATPRLLSQPEEAAPGAAHLPNPAARKTPSCRGALSLCVMTTFALSASSNLSNRHITLSQAGLGSFGVRKTH